MSHVTEKFAEIKSRGRGGFIPFIVAGDPDLRTTQELIVELARSGADLIEVGVPFSDPVADGPVIQRASERALKNGTTIFRVLDCIAQAKRSISTTIVLFSYYNPLLRLGSVLLAKSAANAGVDAILVTDLIPEEAEEWTHTLAVNDLDPIFLAAPTTNDARLDLVAKLGRGFIYAISLRGVTGARERIDEDGRALVKRIRRITNMPVAVGFGISTASQVRQVCEHADAAVVGSAIVAEIERHAGDPTLVHRVGEFARGLTAQIRRPVLN